ncbi:MAG TPA: ATP-binding protein [Bacilli bacterium]|nr:ATP-binding protein [Bacilli bacterium]
MLVNLRLSNYRSFHEEVNLSLRATSDNELQELNVTSIYNNVLEAKNNGILKSAVLFGVNASGKSNILKGLNYMKSAIMYSAVSNPNLIVLNERHLLLQGTESEPSVYEVEFIYNKIYYKYGFEITNRKITHEYLYRRVERLTNVFDRTSTTFSIIGFDVRTTSIIKLDQTTLFLSVARNYGLSSNVVDSITDVLKWFDSVLIVFEETQNSFEIYEYENGKYIHEALNILKQADIGIDSFQVHKEMLYTRADNKFTLNPLTPMLQSMQIAETSDGVGSLDIKTRFVVHDKYGRFASNLDVYLLKNHGFHSEGTKRLLFYLGWILLSLDQGRLLLIDEIDSKLHFILSDYILKQFNSINRNPKNAQIVCTAHNLMLMDEDFRRDQIYFTSKTKLGQSTLLSLSDFKGVRKNDLFSKKYLSGFYTKLPDLIKEI